ncbi:sodium/potassium/calcium exchanger 2-like isoform X3 [Petromyzon marinus]|uniref:sodium/potassium/calcium exchanger 2-like isoform X3 n=1 Tax=Petromyzon marinus TaxID=7757 RepID=UPI003F70CC9F
MAHGRRRRLRLCRVLGLVATLLVATVLSLAYKAAGPPATVPLDSRGNGIFRTRALQSYEGKAAPREVLKPTDASLKSKSANVVKLDESGRNSIDEGGKVSKSEDGTPYSKLHSDGWDRKPASMTSDNKDPLNSTQSTKEMNQTDSHEQLDYPRDLFTLEQRKRGAVVLHMLGMIYMFIALAIVCDEFFVPALGVITEKLAISDDVAGATFMAAGGSAPELFTSLIGVFISHSNVGIGTIVGSAVFNILFVIGMCAVFSREILVLTWWPLFRDVSFYIVGLSMLIIFFLDNLIQWWESMLLLSCYVSYVVFMKFNAKVESFVKQRLSMDPPAKIPGGIDEGDKASGCSSDPLSEPTDTTRLKQGKSRKKRSDEANTVRYSKMMRNSLFQLMMYTLDPLGDARMQEQQQTAAVVAVAKKEAKKKNKRLSTSPAEPTPITPGENEANVDSPGLTSPAQETISPSNKPNGRAAPQKTDAANGASQSVDDASDEKEEEEEEKPLSMRWPESTKKQISYVFLLPLVLPLWITLPDVRNHRSRKFFMVTFFGSILWIAIFSYLMVWWAHQVGETIGITEEIMGLTILAAGTSIPDLITSVIVARKGLGDMAVSSSVGSNIFDITVGLPMPWLMFSLVKGFAPVQVSSNGLFCAIVLLFLMLLFVILTIAACRWHMNKLLGFCMFLLYFVFLIISVMLETRTLHCPVTI